MHGYKASLLGDELIVIVGTDEAVNRKKGFVYQPLAKRIEKVLELRMFIPQPICIVVNIDTDGTCAETLRMVKPDIFAKGAEYNKSNLAQKELDVCRVEEIQILYGVGGRLSSSSELAKMWMERLDSVMKHGEVG